MLNNENTPTIKGAVIFDFNTFFSLNRPAKIALEKAKSASDPNYTKLFKNGFLLKNWKEIEAALNFLRYLIENAPEEEGEAEIIIVGDQYSTELIQELLTCNKFSDHLTKEECNKIIVLGKKGNNNCQSLLQEHFKNNNFSPETQIDIYYHEKNQKNYTQIGNVAKANYHNSGPLSWAKEMEDNTSKNEEEEKVPAPIPTNQKSPIQQYAYLQSEIQRLQEQAKGNLNANEEPEISTMRQKRIEVLQKELLKIATQLELSASKSRQKRLDLTKAALNIKKNYNIPPKAKNEISTEAKKLLVSQSNKNSNPNKKGSPIDQNSTRVNEISNIKSKPNLSQTAKTRSAELNSQEPELSEEEQLLKGVKQTKEDQLQEEQEKLGCLKAELEGQEENLLLAEEESQQAKTALYGLDNTYFDLVEKWYQLLIQIKEVKLDFLPEKYSLREKGNILTEFDTKFGQISNKFKQHIGDAELLGLDPKEIEQIGQILMKQKEEAMLDVDNSNKEKIALYQKILEIYKDYLTKLKNTLTSLQETKKERQLAQQSYKEKHKTISNIMVDMGALEGQIEIAQDTITDLKEEIEGIEEKINPQNQTQEVAENTIVNLKENITKKNEAEINKEPTLPGTQEIAITTLQKTSSATKPHQNEIRTVDKKSNPRNKEFKSLNDGLYKFYAKKMSLLRKLEKLVKGLFNSIFDTTPSTAFTTFQSKNSEKIGSNTIPNSCAASTDKLSVCSTHPSKISSKSKQFVEKRNLDLTKYNPEGDEICSTSKKELENATQLIRKVGLITQMSSKGPSSVGRERSTSLPPATHQNWLRLNT